MLLAEAQEQVGKLRRWQERVQSGAKYLQGALNEPELRGWMEDNHPALLEELDEAAEKVRVWRIKLSDEITKINNMSFS